jgi:hypothetical protein
MRSQLMKNGIYTGEVFHGRHRPFRHFFKYRVFCLLVNLDDLNKLHKKLKIFSLNNYNIISFWNKDHGPRDGSDLRPWITSAAEEKSIDVRGPVFVLCFPRLWGYVFNPLTIYFCHDLEGWPSAILYEVKNTFGEQHGYLLPIENPDVIIQDTDKVFYVSPFLDMDCHYRFRIRMPGDSFKVEIQEFYEGEKILTATWNGVRKPLTDKTLALTVAKYPLLSFKIILAIHWQALHLLAKGAKFHWRKPKTLPDIT